MSVCGQLPYEVSRAWNQEWDLLKPLCGDALLPSTGPVRYLHPALEIRLLDGKGRGVVATEELKPGELILLDSPILTAQSFEDLLGSAIDKCQECDEFRATFLSMCGDDVDAEARAKITEPPSGKLIRNIIRHNYHGVDWPPIDGAIFNKEPVVGLWPLASLINTSLHPNVTRSCAGYAMCYRIIKPLHVGDEVLDNYLDLRLPHSLRRSMLQSNHGIGDEGPDSFDAPSTAVTQIQEAHEKAKDLLTAGDQESAQTALMALAELSNRCCSHEVLDPAFHDTFRDFAITAGQLGDANMCLQGLAKAMEYATAREPFSVISYLLTLRMVHMACLAGEDIDMDTRKQLEKLAREHFSMVYGSIPGAFEALNPDLMGELATPGSD